MPRINLRFSVLFCGAMMFISSCDKCNKPKDDSNTVTPVKSVTVNPPLFNSDSAYAYTQAQVDFGPRNMNSKGHDECGKWLIEKLKPLVDTVYLQHFDQTTFDGVNLHCTNIIGAINPKAKTRILLTSHWDSRPWADQDKVDRNKPFLSASDGASGVATLLEVARDIKTKALNNVGIDIFFNDAEDYGYAQTLDGLVKVTGETENTFCIGAQYWSKNPHVPGYKADFGILLDMAAGHNAVFTRDGTSSFNAAWVQDMVWSNAQQIGLSSFFSNQNTPALTDDHYYINQISKIPTIDIISYDATSPSGIFPAYWHTHNDNMSVIDKLTLDAVGRTLLYTIYKYDAEHTVQ
ncbi:MAG TPA: M28 family peptidase [Chitinophagales bacterium]|nr:M28 family peptidase [Chitinophagales bacterium]